MSKTSEIVRLKKTGMSNKSICHILKVSNEYVRHVLLRNGLTKKGMTEEEDQQMIAMSKKGMTAQEIADFFERSVYTIRRRLRRYGIVGKPGVRPGPKKSHKWLIKTHKIVKP